MKTIKLLNLKLTNFKGIKSFELNANGEDMKVFGENATGKTTIFDAFVWLLFGKDSQNSTQFEIKTLRDGKPVHKLNHEVEATLLVDGQELTLKKVYKEKWTKKRGSVTESFSGHTTDYYIDGVPSKKKEYEGKISEIVDEEVFKLLTNPAHFNEQLKWQDRRKTLLEIAGDVTDEEVIASNESLAKLTEIIGKRSIDDHKKVVTAKKKEINQELDRIPIRIDEIHRGLPDTDGFDKEGIIAQLNELSNQIDAKNEQINNLRNGSKVNEIKKQISDIDLQIANVRNEHTQNEQQELFKLKTRLQEEQSNVSILDSEVSNHEQKKDMNERNVKDIEKQMQDLREQWIKQNSQEFDHESECSCPTCGQDLPEEQIEETKANFNRNKSELLETINAKGIELKNKVESIKQENEQIQSEIDKVNKEIEKKNASISKLESEIKQAESTVKPVDENEQFINLNDEKQTLEQKIEALQQSVDESVQKVQQEVASLKEQQSALQMDLSKLQQSEQSLARIKELEAQEKKLATEFEELEHQLYLTEEFIRTKVALLEERINSKFKYARFKLFEEQINGGLKEVCETTYEGVPYSGGLNNAARINVGLDIINTLSAHYDVQATIFVDNAESVTKLIDIDSQVISLVVSEQDKELRIETENQTESVVA